MKKIVSLIALAISINSVNAQSLYFPPTSGNVWDTMAPSALGWCQPNIDSLYSFLQSKNTDAFIVLKDGKIVLEKYFGTFTADSIHDWFSASKSLTAMLTGIASENNAINIDSPVTHYLGAGWTSETAAQEDSITILNLLTMTSGTNPAPTGSCANTDTSSTCLQYLVPAGSQWAYHTGAYRKMETVLSVATGKTYNSLSENYIGGATGMTGAWIEQEFVSIPRSAARFGLLALNKGVWASDTVLHDTAYFRSMTNTSQHFNLSYGYLWWLNGKSSYMSPGSQTVYPGQLIPNAPQDMFCALGKNDQKIYVVPSTNMVVVRLGDAADSVADALTAFDNQLWGYIDSLSCSNTIDTMDTTGISGLYLNQNLHISPNPVNSILYLPQANSTSFKEIVIYNVLGEMMAEYPYRDQIDVSLLPKAIYILRVTDADGHFAATAKIVKE